MKTLSSVISEVRALQIQYSSTKDLKEKKKLSADFLKLKPLLLILQSGVSEDSLKKQLEAEERRLDILEERIETKIKELSSGGGYVEIHNQLRKRLESEYLIKDIEKRISVLKSILD